MQWRMGYLRRIDDFKSLAFDSIDKLVVNEQSRPVTLAIGPTKHFTAVDNFSHSEVGSIHTVSHVHEFIRSKIPQRSYRDFRHLVSLDNNCRQGSEMDGWQQVDEVDLVILWGSQGGHTPL